MLGTGKVKESLRAQFTNMCDADHQWTATFNQVFRRTGTCLALKY